MNFIGLDTTRMLMKEKESHLDTVKIVTNKLVFIFYLLLCYLKGKAP